jgi:hypothetical protein
MFNASIVAAGVANGAISGRSRMRAASGASFSVMYPAHADASGKTRPSTSGFRIVPAAWFLASNR